MQGNLRERFGIPPNQAHRALDDSQVMQDVVSHMLKMNGALTIADVVARKSKCSGTLEDLFGPGKDKLLQTASMMVVSMRQLKLQLQSCIQQNALLLHCRPVWMGNILLSGSCKQCSAVMSRSSVSSAINERLCVELSKQSLSMDEGCIEFQLLLFLQIVPQPLGFASVILVLDQHSNQVFRLWFILRISSLPLPSVAVV